MLHAPLVLSLFLSPQTTAVDRADFLGTWHGVYESVTPDGDRELDFALWEEDGRLFGGLRTGYETALLEGHLAPGDERLVLDVLVVGAQTRLELVPTDGGLAGVLTYDDEDIALDARRTSLEIADDLRLEVDMEVELPRTIDREGLPEFLEEVLRPIIDEWLVSERAVGLSVAILLDFELADVRSFGWQDFARRIPASGQTRYRWASISKSVTAALALQLVESGRLDLDADVRDYVPEFPEKRWTVTTADLLSHQGGVVHYQHDPIVTVREYDDPNPFRSRILALDMFRETPLLFEPGTRYSYTTHGYALLGAVVERAGKQRFAEQVDERVARRLGMKSLQPDFHQSVEIPNQTVGYASTPDGRILDAGDSNVAWKLAGGGFLSTVGDLARFGLGLMNDDLLSEGMRQEMFQDRKTSEGASTGYGRGVSVEEVDGFQAIGHGGAQRKTRTYLLVVPELGLGAAVMCNTEHTNPGRLARGLVDAMIE